VYSGASPPNGGGIMTDNRTYLGDGIYASFEHGMI
jgi:hypothetical protein